MSKAAERVLAYIDGFNLYYGIRECGKKSLYWLNVQALVDVLLTKDQSLVRVKYFTARVSGAPPGVPRKIRVKKEAQRMRQNTFLEAIGTLPQTEILEGHFLHKPVRCPLCKRTWNKAEEKMTDAKIATEMVSDAFTDKFDVALLISGDSDLEPPVTAVTGFFPAKRVVVAFPPNRFSADLQAAVRGSSFAIWESKIKRCQFPDTVVRHDGHKLIRPAEWH